MTRDKDFKKIVRERMEKTGEAYSTARRQLEASPAGAAVGDSKGTFRGWAFCGPGAGDYDGGLDPLVRHEGRPCAFLRQVGPPRESYASILQVVGSELYVGRRVRFSAWLKVGGPRNGSLFMQVGGAGEATFGHGLFHGADSNEWQWGAVTLDVPEGAKRIAFGLAMGGPGEAWMSGATFEIVDASVPVSPPSLRAEPVNLTFEDVPS
jgi:hypothetical protein